MDNQKRRRIMKKSRAKKVYAIVIIVCIALVTAALLLNRPTPTPSFKFLDGREPMTRLKVLPGEQTLFICSFEADANDVCDSAHSELSALRYLEITPPSNPPLARKYELRNRRRTTTIVILDKHRYNVYSTPQQSEYSSPDRLESHYADGWVSVQITQRIYPSRLKIMWQRLTYKVRSWF